MIRQARRLRGFYSFTKTSLQCVRTSLMLQLKDIHQSIFVLLNPRILNEKVIFASKQRRYYIDDTSRKSSAILGKCSSVLVHNGERLSTLGNLLVEHTCKTGKTSRSKYEKGEGSLLTTIRLAGTIGRLAASDNYLPFFGIGSSSNCVNVVAHESLLGRLVFISISVGNTTGKSVRCFTFGRVFINCLAYICHLSISVVGVGAVEAGG